MIRNSSIPHLLILLPGKSEETHSRFFCIIKDLDLTLDPESVTIAFEKKQVSWFSLWHTGIKLQPWIYQFSSVTQSCPTLCHPMDSSTPGLPVHHQLPEPTQIHVRWVGDAIQPSHPLSSPFPSAFSLSQNWALFQGVNSSHQVAKVLEFQLQHQSFQWIFRTNFL